MSICAHCSAENTSTATFCTTCGRSLSSTATDTTLPTSVSEVSEKVPVARLSRRRVAVGGVVLVAAIVLLMVGALVSSTGAADWLTGERFTQSELDDAVDEARRAGESSGYDRGLTDGKANGYDDGYAAGSSDGYDRGKRAGCEAVFDEIESDTGYSMIVAWDSIWRTSRGDYYYTRIGMCN